MATEQQVGTAVLPEDHVGAEDHGSGLSLIQNRTGSAGQIIEQAMEWVGKVPYVWGGIPGKGQTPFANGGGWDCSGFMYWLDQNFGNGSLVMGSHHQYAQAQSDGTFINDMRQLMRGDLIFFDTGNTAGSGANLNRAGHVGMYIGNGQFVHAANQQVGTIVSDLAGYYAGQFIGGKRMAWSGGSPTGSGTFASCDRIPVEVDELNFRDQPTTSTTVIDKLSAGTELCVTGASKEADGYTWYPVRDANSRRGWVAGTFCSLAEAGACGFETRDRVAVNESGLRLRQGPEISSQILETLAAGANLCVTGAPQDADGYTWYPVRERGGSNRSGWVASKYCDLVEANGCGSTQSTGGLVGATFRPTGPRFAGGNLDSAEHLINASAAKHSVPANFLAAIVAHESTGDWERDGSRFSDVRPESGPLLPYIGVFEKTATSRAGMSSEQFRALLGDQAGQIDLLGSVLRSIHDQLKQMNSSYNWLNVASYFFSGHPVPRGWCDELGNCDDRYYNNIRDWWELLEPGFNSR